MINFEKIHKLTEGIRKIEEKMIELDALAKQALTSNLKINICIKDPDRKPTVKTEDGDLHFANPWDTIFNSTTYSQRFSIDENYDKVFNHDITDTVLVKIISVMMESYKEQRRLYIQELKSIEL